MVLWNRQWKFMKTEAVTLYTVLSFRRWSASYTGFEWRFKLKSLIQDISQGNVGGGQCPLQQSPSTEGGTCREQKASGVFLETCGIIYKHPAAHDFHSFLCTYVWTISMSGGFWSQRWDAPVLSAVTKFKTNTCLSQSAKSSVLSVRELRPFTAERAMNRAGIFPESCYCQRWRQPDNCCVTWAIHELSPTPKP